MHNLRVVASEGCARNKNINLVLSSVPSFHRAMNRIQEQKLRAAAPKSQSTHIGQPKDRLDFGVCEVTRVYYNESDWGVTTIIGFLTAEGNELVWFASGEKDIKRGSKVSVTATVKKHHSYKGVSQTVINRAKLTEL